MAAEATDGDAYIAIVSRAIESLLEVDSTHSSKFSKSKGEVVFVLKVAPEQPSEELAKSINSAIANPQVEVFRANFKAKTNQLTVSFRTTAAAPARSPANAVAAVASGGKKGKKKGGGIAVDSKQEDASQPLKPTSKLFHTADEIVESVNKKLDVSLSASELAALQQEVRNILGRFQTWAYVEGFKGQEFAAQTARMQSPL
eukprot:TRINITY_DN1329_c1_g1_i2.p2 TRINITY_DN1329_c1_g1~~TRINITY_DN1329_c1_g1_i2.p2  ORF type:complete len:201 (+),score=58.81 TRINITY_DN1329_c1_g1_i2:1060-1662(+)